MNKLKKQLQDDLENVVHIILVEDEASDLQGLYISGILKIEDEPINISDMFDEVKDMTINISRVLVSVPNYNDMPEKFEDCMPWILNSK